MKKLLFLIFVFQINAQNIEIKALESNQFFNDIRIQSMGGAGSIFGEFIGAINNSSTSISRMENITAFINFTGHSNSKHKLNASLSARIKILNFSTGIFRKFEYNKKENNSAIYLNILPLSLFYDINGFTISGSLKLIEGQEAKLYQTDGIPRSIFFRGQSLDLSICFENRFGIFNLAINNLYSNVSSFEYGILKMCRYLNLAYGKSIKFALKDLLGLDLCSLNTKFTVELQDITSKKDFRKKTKIGGECSLIIPFLDVAIRGGLDKLKICQGFGIKVCNILQIDFSFRNSNFMGFDISLGYL